MDAAGHRENFPLVSSQQGTPLGLRSALHRPIRMEGKFLRQTASPPSEYFTRRSSKNCRYAIYIDSSQLVRHLTVASVAVTDVTFSAPEIGKLLVR